MGYSLTKSLVSIILLSCFPMAAHAMTAAAQTLDLTAAPVGYFSLMIFAIAYMVVMAEEFTHLRKSKPVILAAGIIWALIALIYAEHGGGPAVESALRHNLLEFAELFLFLLAAMTYVNAMDERQIFEALRAWLVRKGFS